MQDNPSAYAQQVCWLPLDRISPRPSMRYDSAEDMSLDELAESIRQHGLIRPVTVQATHGGRYVIVSGNRRLMACRMAGMTCIDAVVLAGCAADSAAQELLGALLSGQLHYLDESAVMQRLLTDYGMTRDELARALGCTAGTIRERLRLTGLDRELCHLLIEEGLPERCARALLKLPDKHTRLSIAKQAAREHLCVRDVELLVASAQTRLPVPPLPGGRTISLVRDHRLYLNAIRAIIAQMQEAGIDARAEERACGDSMELVLHMPTRKRRACQRFSQ